MLSRRQFMGTAAAAGVSLAAQLPQSAPAQTRRRTIVDAQVHLWKAESEDWKWVPGMTPQTADAILDWIDRDEEPREFGAERSYYTAMGLRPPRNGRLTSLEDLLQVRGVSPEWLYGNDLNRDGLLDQRESDDSGRFSFGSSQFRDGRMRYAARMIVGARLDVIAIAAKQSRAS